MLRPAYAWVNRIVGASQRRPVRKWRSSLPRLLAAMETLEDRTLLATVTVHVYSDNFSTNPSGQPVVAPTIHTGDTIHWVWGGGTHTSTSVSVGAETWNSGTHSPGDTLDHTFTHTGTFTYSRKFHGSDNGDGTAAGMSGTVKVIGIQSIAVTPANPSVVRGEAASGSPTTAQGPRPSTTATASRSPPRPR